LLCRPISLLPRGCRLLFALSPRAEPSPVLHFGLLFPRRTTTSVTAEVDSHFSIKFDIFRYSAVSTSHPSHHTRISARVSGPAAFLPAIYPSDQIPTLTVVFGFDALDLIGPNILDLGIRAFAPLTSMSHQYGTPSPSQWVAGRPQTPSRVLTRAQSLDSFHTPQTRPRPGPSPAANPSSGAPMPAPPQFVSLAPAAVQNSWLSNSSSQTGSSSQAPPPASSQSSQPYNGSSAFAAQAYMALTSAILQRFQDQECEARLGSDLWFHPNHHGVLMNRVAL
jgi:hypothetical protein